LHQEAIAGKCNIICISKDSRNPYPSYAEVKMAEFVFHRFFDVGKCKILDKIDDKIAGIEGMLSHHFENYSKKFLSCEMELHLHLWVFRGTSYITIHVLYLERSSKT